MQEVGYASLSHPTALHYSGLRLLARALHVSLDALVFEEGERGPSEEMRLQFEAISQLPDEDQRAVRAMLDGMIVKHQAKKIVGSLSS